MVGRWERGWGERRNGGQVGERVGGTCGARWSRGSASAGILKAKGRNNRQVGERIHRFHHAWYSSTISTISTYYTIRQKRRVGKQADAPAWPSPAGQCCGTRQAPPPRAHSVAWRTAGRHLRPAAPRPPAHAREGVWGGWGVEDRRACANERVQRFGGGGSRQDMRSGMGWWL
eukprot:366221-Chlamydomonas_euryale.AAC.9